jgi:ABC-type glycerol-3-phosphate transport system permease component
VKPKPKRRASARQWDLALHLPLLALLALTFYPFLFLLQTSLKDNSQFFHDFWGIRPPFHWRTGARFCDFDFTAHTPGRTGGTSNSDR